VFLQQTASVLTWPWQLSRTAKRGLTTPWAPYQQAWPGMVSQDVDVFQEYCLGPVHATTTPPSWDCTERSSISILLLAPKLLIYRP
jgi:hypothetical protein